MKRLSIYIGILVAGIILGYYLLPSKEKIVIKYKDKIVTQNQVVTKIEYKDGKTVTVTKTDTVEVEKIKEIDKLKIIKNKHQLAVLADMELQGLKSLSLVYYTPLALGFDIGLGGRYCLDNNYTVSFNNNNLLRYNSAFDRIGFIISLKYNF